MKHGNLVRGVTFLVLLTGLFLAFKFLPAGEYLGLLLEKVQQLGAWGPVILGAAYVAATVLMAPGSLLTLGSGFLFGLVVGTITVSAASTLGATAAFLIGRTLARDWVAKLAANNPKFGAVDRAVQENGFKIVLLTRLSPVFPFNLLNYLYSVTSVRLRDYVLGSWIGMLPGTIMYVYFGSAFKSLTDVLAGNVEGGVAQKVLLVVGLIVTVIVTVYVTRIARRAIRQYVPAEAPVEA